MAQPTPTADTATTARPSRPLLHIWKRFVYMALSSVERWNRPHGLIRSRIGTSCLDYTPLPCASNRASRCWCAQSPPPLPIQVVPSPGRPGSHGLELRVRLSCAALHGQLHLVAAFPGVAVRDGWAAGARELGS